MSFHNHLLKSFSPASFTLCSGFGFVPQFVDGSVGLFACWVLLCFLGVDGTGMPPWTAAMKTTFPLAAWLCGCFLCWLRGHAGCEVCFPSHMA